MTIDRVGPVDPVSKLNKTNKTNTITKSNNGDMVNVSEEARRSASLQQMADIVRSTPDIRMDRVEEVKAKLQNPDYIDETVMNSVADSILDVFGL